MKPNEYTRFDIEGSSYTRNVNEDLWFRVTVERNFSAVWMGTRKESKDRQSYDIQHVLVSLHAYKDEAITAACLEVERARK